MERRYKPNEFAKIANVAVTTLQRWDREGTLKAERTLTNRRYYTDKHIEQLRRKER